MLNPPNPRASSGVFTNTTLDCVAFSTLVQQLHRIVKGSDHDSSDSAVKSCHDAIAYAFYRFICSIFVYSLPQAIAHFPRHRVVSCSLRRIVSTLTVPDRSLVGHKVYIVYFKIFRDP